MKESLQDAVAGRHARLVKISLWSFVVCIGCTGMGLVAIVNSLAHPSYSHFFYIPGDISRPFLVCIGLSPLAMITSLGAGLAVVKRRPVVLWWIAPLICIGVAVSWFIADILRQL